MLRLLSLLLAFALLGTAAAAPAAPTRGGCPVPVPRVRLPAQGPGWRIPTTWHTRGLSYGTSEMIGLIKRTAARLLRGHAGAILEVADISPRNGGASRWHRTHRHGEDVDLLLFAVDAAGQPAPAGKAMVAFDCTGKGAATDEAGTAVPPLTFDVARNWALVRALAEERHAKVEDILIAACLRQKLLAHARATKAPRGVVARAEKLMRQPRLSPHNNHMHVRIAATAESCVAAAPARK
ncbi:MAG TPA: penicillin-insensitive murein endopeptidase [Polyangia bacterium]